MKKSILLAATLTLFSSSAFAAKYSIIVDAGSSGSKLHLFQYEMNSGSMPVITEIFTESNKIPLASFEKNPAEAGSSLKLLFDDVSKKLLDQQIDPRAVPVRVLATAGMRLIPEDSQQSIYANVRSYLQRNYPFSYGQMQTISGKMEGLYDWLDVNYLAGHFQDQTSTVGTIDMGGASTQIAFETNDTSKPESLISLKINGKNYTVFSASFLGLGLDQARDQMKKYDEIAACFPAGYSILETVGAYDFSKCASLYRDVIQKHDVTSAIIPVTNHNFIAFSGVFYTFSFLNTDQTLDQASVQKRIQTVCTQSWEDLKKEYSATTPEKYLSVYCADAAYLNGLLYNTYELQGNQLSVMGQIDKHNIDWAVGAELYELIK